jgi:hypothetical protein
LGRRPEPKGLRQPAEGELVAWAGGGTRVAQTTHHFFNGTVAFSAAADNGNVNFMITVNANFVNKFTQYAFGGIIRAGEDSTWSNLLTNVQNYCGQGGVH